MYKRQVRDDVKLGAAVKKLLVPSLNQSIGLNRNVAQTNGGRTITIVRNNYLKNIVEELLEESNNQSDNKHSEIAYISTQVNGVPTQIMIDTGSNISLIDSIKLQKIQEASKTIILTLPISNIVLVGATGWQNRTVRKQVQLELTSDGQIVTMTFLVASGLPFQMLIDCDMLHQYSAIIDLSKYKLILKKGDIQWITELTNSDEIQPNKTMYCDDLKEI